MTRKLAAILASASLFVAIAANATPDKKKSPKNPSCPVCKMEMAATKSKKNSIAVKVGKKTYYCCDKCPMDKKTTHAGDAKK